MSEQEQFFINTGEQINDSVKGQLFGKPCFKIKKKAFVCFYNNDMVFKLTGDTHGDALCLDGSQLFDPSNKNRPMKEWVQVPYDYKHLWLTFAKASAKYILTK